MREGKAGCKAIAGQTSRTTPLAAKLKQFTGRCGKAGGADVRSGGDFAGSISDRRHAERTAMASKAFDISDEDITPCFGL